MYTTMLERAKELIADLTQGINTTLPAHKDIVDDMTEDRPGYCFASSHNRNIDSLRFLNILAKDNAEWVQSRGGGQVVWKHVKAVLWMSKAQELNELLLVLMHMGGGQPARGQELFPTLYRNKQNIHRSLFVSPMGITWILNYNKASGSIIHASIYN
jgi:hypothetical protein